MRGCVTVDHVLMRRVGDLEGAHLSGSERLDPNRATGELVDTVGAVSQLALERQLAVHVDYLEDLRLWLRVSDAEHADDTERQGRGNCTFHLLLAFLEGGQNGRRDCILGTKRSGQIGWPPYFAKVGSLSWAALVVRVVAPSRPLMRGA
jgi:hypothetical protein